MSHTLRALTVVLSLVFVASGPAEAARPAKQLKKQKPSRDKANKPTAKKPSILKRNGVYRFARDLKRAVAPSKMEKLAHRQVDQFLTEHPLFYHQAQSVNFLGNGGSTAKETHFMAGAFAVQGAATMGLGLQYGPETPAGATLVALGAGLNGLAAALEVKGYRGRERSRAMSLYQAARLLGEEGGSEEYKTKVRKSLQKLDKATIDYYGEIFEEAGRRWAGEYNAILNR